MSAALEHSDSSLSGHDFSEGLDGWIEVDNSPREDYPSERESLMKIISWNVNGIRACHRRASFGSIGSASTRCALYSGNKAWPEQLDSDLLVDHGYEASWATAEKKGIAGSLLFEGQAGPHHHRVVRRAV